MNVLNVSPRMSMILWQQVYDKWELFPSFYQQLRLMFVPWNTVVAPAGTIFCTTTIDGLPIYRYKYMDGKVFYLSPLPQ